MTIRGTEHAGPHEALQHLEVSGDDHTILVGGKCLTVSKAEAGRLETSGIPFAYLCDRDGQIVTVPVNDD